MRVCVHFECVHTHIWVWECGASLWGTFMKLINTCMHVHKHTWTYTNTRGRTQTHVDVHKHTCTYTNTRGRNQTHVHVHKDTWMYRGTLCMHAQATLHSTLELMSSERARQIALATPTAAPQSAFDVSFVLVAVAVRVWVAPSTSVTHGSLARIWVSVLKGLTSLPPSSICILSTSSAWLNQSLNHKV